MYHFVTLEVGSLELRCQQGRALSDGSGGEPLSLPASGVRWQPQVSLACGCRARGTRLSSLVSSYCLPYGLVCLCPDGPFGIRTSVLWSSNDLVLNLITSVIVSLLVQRVKHLPAMRETWVQSLGQKDPLEEDMATHSSILA